MVQADLNFASATLLVSYGPSSDIAEDVMRVVRSTGHGISPLDESGIVTDDATRPWLDRNLAEVATVGSGAGTAIGAALGWIGAPAGMVIAAYLIAIIFGGLLVWRRALISLKARILDMNVLMSVAVLGAAALGEWGEGATVFFLYALGGLLESRSLERTRRSIRDLMDLAPPLARVRTESGWVEMAAESVVIGDLLSVRPGERFPLDGEVEKGDSAVDESPITGESTPVDKAAGDHVFAGSLNTSAALEVRATSTSADTTLSRIVYLVEEAQASRAPSQTFVERFSRVYTPVVFALALLVALVPSAIVLLSGADSAIAAEWVRRALVVLVVSCPCALVISTPVSIVCAITRASRDGVLVKGGAFIESAGQVRAVAFDKTGTLTVGRPVVSRVVVFGEQDESAVVAVAAALEAQSNHPVARAVVAEATRRGLVIEEAEALTESPGRGVRGLVDGRVHELCSPACAAETAQMSERALAAVTQLESSGATALVLVADGRVEALLGVEDEVRPDASGSLKTLHATGIEHTVMLTGDNERVAESVAARAGVTSFLARLLPEAKTEAVLALKQRYGVVAMVGDGINDAPALSAADIGVAMGAAGTDIALETADVALMRDDLTALAGFFALGRRTMATIRANIAFSIVVKVVVLLLALTGNATLWMAVFADTGVSLLVILNGMRLLRART